MSYFPRSAALGLAVLCAFAGPASAIRNGTPESSLPYNGVGMILPTAGHPLSTGTMVSQFVFLTAARAVVDDPYPAGYEFTLGPGLTAHATAIRMHPEFEGPHGRNFFFNVALVALNPDEVRNWPTVGRSAIREVLVPNGALATGVGFGETQTGLGSGDKRSGSFLVNEYVPGADNAGNEFPNVYIEAVPGNASNQMCCNGDFGGPLFYDNQIAGVASYRFVALCEDEGPVHYVSLLHLSDWIHDNLSEMDPSVPLDDPVITDFAPAAGPNSLVSNVFDNNPATAYASDDFSAGTMIDFAFPAPTLISGFDMTQRNDIARVLTSRLVFDDGPGFGFPIATVDLVHTNAAGAHDSFTFPPVNARYVRWDVLTTNSSVFLANGAAEMNFYHLPGDYNGNGTVDAADYVVWRKKGGTQAEYNTWRANFGKTLGFGSGSGLGASANTAVPEPSASVLLMIAAAGWCLRRDRAA